MCSHESPRGDRKRLKEEFFPLFVLFVLFGQAKRTLKEKNHNVTFPLSYFCVTKSTKSHQRERSPLFENSSPVSATPTNALRALVHSPRARVSRASHAWQVCAARDKSKVGGFAAPHNFCHTTRANTSHEKAEQIRARIVCTPAEKEGRAWGSLCADESKDFRQPSPVGEGVSHRLTDEVLSLK